MGIPLKDIRYILIPLKAVKKKEEKKSRLSITVYLKAQSFRARFTTGKTQGFKAAITLEINNQQHKKTIKSTLKHFFLELI